MPETYAVLDLGSNTFRLMAADRAPGAGGPLMSGKRVWQEIPRLSEGLKPGGPFGEEAKKRAFAALDSFQEELRKRPAQKVLAGATMAARLSSEGPWLMGEIRKRYGWDAKILTGLEEARLTARGVLSGLSDNGKGFLIFDIGGRSTELILADGKSLGASVSLPLGVVLLTEECLKNDPPLRGELSEIRERCLKGLRGPSFAHGGGDFELVGTAGTVTTIASMLLGLEKYDPRRVNGARVERAAMEGLLRSLSKETVLQRSSRKGLHPKRADVIVSGLILALSVMDHYGKDYIVASDNGLLEGLWLWSAGPGGDP